MHQANRLINHCKQSKMYLIYCTQDGKIVPSETTNDDLKKENLELKTENNDMKLENDSLKAKNNFLNAVNSSLKEENDVLMKQINELENNSLKMKNEHNNCAGNGFQKVSNYFLFLKLNHSNAEPL